MLQVTVKRSEWYRGRREEDDTYLHSEKGMCCLGFACIAAGLTKSQIYHIATPANLAPATPLPESLSELVISDTESGRRLDSGVCSNLVGWNDDPTITDSERERLLAERGKEAGIAFRFVD